MRHAFQILEELGAECDRLGVRVVDVHGESGLASEFFAKIVSYIEAREKECDRPTLTDEEREALYRVADDAAYRGAGYTEGVVRGLLKRLK